MWLNLELSSALSLGEQLSAVQLQIATLPSRGIGYGLLKYMSDDAIRVRMHALTDAELFYCFHGEQRDVARGCGQFGSLSSGPLQGRSGQRRHLFEINAVIQYRQFRMRWYNSIHIHRLETLQRLCASVKLNLFEIARLDVVSATYMRSSS